ncbi:hypothetical protein ACJMK2_019793 [Sinanodonta woodiana]|uniref:Zinc finger PHD-type domain-containing protein n=1 Tax=Sinanodonta woodiana TaxID=1069815 RepID=A0ABD3TXA3_SINWO
MEMTDEVFKAPRNKRSYSQHDIELDGSSPKKGRTKKDFYAFCSWVLDYTQYEPPKQEELRAQNNTSPLGSSGSLTDSYSSDTTMSTLSTSSRDEGTGDLQDSDDDSWDLITCHCLKPYAGRPMIECNECNTWIHLSCAKIRKTNIPEVYVCQHCKDSKLTTRKSNRQRIENKRITI